MKDNSDKSLLDKLNFFEKIVLLVKKHGKITVLFSVLILFFVFNIFHNPLDVNKLLDRYTERVEDIHQQGLLKRQRADDEIPLLLESLRLKVDADRVMLLEFHNGSKNSSALEFYHFTATYEVIDEDNDSIDYVNDQYRNQNTGNYSTLFRQLKKERYIFSNNIYDEQKSKIVAKMAKNDVLSFYICAIYNNNNDLVGVLTITNNDVNRLDESKLNRITPFYTHRIANLIAGINNQ